jgi:hypothetical protein
MRAETFREGNHGVGASHLEVEPDGDGLSEQLDVAVDDVATVFAEVDGDALGSGDGSFERGMEDIRLAIANGPAGAVPITGLPEGGDVVDVDAERGHGRA